MGIVLFAGCARLSCVPSGRLIFDVMQDGKTSPDGVMVGVDCDIIYKQPTRKQI